MVSVENSCFGDRRFEPQPNLLLCWLYFIFYWWIVFPEIFRYILKLILNYYFKFERNLSWILLPQELPYFPKPAVISRTFHFEYPSVLSRFYFKLSYPLQGRCGNGRVGLILIKWNILNGFQNMRKRREELFRETSPQIGSTNARLVVPAGLRHNGSIENNIITEQVGTTRQFTASGIWRAVQLVHGDFL